MGFACLFLLSVFLCVVMDAACAHNPAATVKFVRGTSEPMVWPSIFPSAYVYGDGGYGITRRSECDAIGVKLDYRPQLHHRELKVYVIDGDDMDCCVVCEGSGALEKRIIKDSILLCGRSSRDPLTVMYDLHLRWGCIHAVRLYACIARWSSDLKKFGAMPGSDMNETVKIVGENAGFDEFFINKNVGARIKAMMRHVPHSCSRVVGANATRTTELHTCNSCRMMWGELHSFTIANIDDAGQSLMKFATILVRVVRIPVFGVCLRSMILTSCQSNNCFVWWQRMPRVWFFPSIL